MIVQRSARRATYISTTHFTIFKPFISKKKIGNEQTGAHASCINTPVRDKK